MKNYQTFYRRITKPLVQHPWLIRSLRWLNGAIVVGMYVSYILLLLWVALFAGGINVHSGSWFRSSIVNSASS